MSLRFYYHKFYNILVKKFHVVFSAFLRDCFLKVYNSKIAKNHNMLWFSASHIYLQRKPKDMRFPVWEHNSLLSPPWNMTRVRT